MRDRVPPRRRSAGRAQGIKAAIESPDLHKGEAPARGRDRHFATSLGFCFFLGSWHGRRGWDPLDFEATPSACEGAKAFRIHKPQPNISYLSN